MPRDNLLGSASLEFFEFIKKENVKDLIKHLVVNYRERLLGLSSMPTFRDIILRYDQTQGYTSNMDYFLEGEDEIGRRPQPTRLMEQINVEQEQEEYWATSDPEEEEDSQNKDPEKAPSTNGSTASRPLVDYASDEETDENVDPQASESQSDVASDAVGSPIDSSLGVVPPLERLSEKRRREEDEDEDELGKLLHNKRRNSSGSVGSGSGTSHGVLRRRKSFNAGPTSGNGPKKIAISLSSALRTGSGPGSNEDS
jgi:protein phosphatase-4 regulatory subunit 3